MTEDRFASAEYSQHLVAIQAGDRCDFVEL
jgi:hypothetical protein